MITSYRPFWFVWNPAGHAPTYKHFNEGEAIREAERLAKQNPGQDFIVLQSVTLYRKDDVLRINLRARDDAPF